MEFIIFSKSVSNFQNLSPFPLSGSTTKNHVSLCVYTVYTRTFDFTMILFNKTC